MLNRLQNDDSFISSFCSRKLNIQSESGRLIPFELNSIQRCLGLLMQEQKAEGRGVRLVVLKARRFGISTYILGRFYAMTSSFPGLSSVILAHEPEATSFLFLILKRFHELRMGVGVETRANSGKRLEFNNESGTGLGSNFSIGSVGKSDFGRSQRVSHLHLSEVSSYPPAYAKDVLDGLLQTVPDEAGTEIIYESTGKPSSGLGGLEFFNAYNRCRRRVLFHVEHGKIVRRMKENEKASRDNAYISVFLPWFVYDRYAMDGDILEMDEEEKELVLLYGLTDRQLLWRRHAIENKCRGDAMVFRREYPSSEEDAWAAASDTVFDLKRLGVVRAKDQREPVSKMRFDFGLRRFVNDGGGNVWFWESPRDDVDYVIGVDVAAGLRLDFSTFEVLDWVTGRQVCEGLFSDVSADRFGEVLFYIGRLFGTAMIAVERNAGFGIGAIQRLIGMGYENLYQTRSPIPTASESESSLYGWTTTPVSKVAAVNWGVEVFCSGVDGLVRSGRLYDEMGGYIRDESGKMRARHGSHDDLLMAWFIAQFVRRGERPEYPFKFLRDEKMSAMAHV